METTQTSFETKLAFGKEGEHEVAKWFIEKHYCALTLYTAVFITTVNKFKATKQPALVTLRKLQGSFWTLEKSERV